MESLKDTDQIGQYATSCCRCLVCSRQTLVPTKETEYSDPKGEASLGTKIECLASGRRDLDLLHEQGSEEIDNPSMKVICATFAQNMYTLHLAMQMHSKWYQNGRVSRSTLSLGS